MLFQRIVVGYLSRDRCDQRGTSSADKTFGVERVVLLTYVHFVPLFFVFLVRRSVDEKDDEN